MYDAEGRWIPDLSAKGLELFDARERFILAWGPRKTGKTISALHKLCRHAFEMPTTTIAIVALTLKVGRIGPWSDLQRYILPQWFDANIGLRLTKGESWMPDTKMCYFRVGNPKGYEAQIELHSCEYPDEAEEKFKGGRWSMVYISEADTFPESTPFDVLGDQLRNPLVPYNRHQILLDANPAKQGQNHWLYKKFFQKEALIEKSPEYAALFREMRFDYCDNPFLPAVEREELRVKYDSDPQLKARFWDGLWIADFSNCIFQDVFRMNLHVIGGPDPSAKGETLDLVPSGQCTELVTGWDMGDRNHAFVILAPRVSATGLLAYDVIDEIVHIGKMVSLRAFVAEICDRLDYWEGFMRDEYKVTHLQWRHWSDSSAWKFKSALDSNEQLEVGRITNGRIVMHAAPKSWGTIEGRIMLARKLLHENRLFVSHRCKNVVDSFNNLRGKGPTKMKVDVDDKYKHTFDAVTYALSNEIPVNLRGGTATTRRGFTRPFGGKKPTAAMFV